MSKRNVPSATVSEERLGLKIWRRATGDAVLLDDWVAALMELPEGVLLTDGAEVVRYANPAAAEMTGWTLNELAGMPLQQLLSIEELTNIAAVRGAPNLRELKRYHCLLRTKSGERREVSVSVGRPRRADASSAIYLIRNVRRQREIERRLIAQLAEKHELEAFGRQASGVLHDLRHLNNLLSLTVKNFVRNGGDPVFRGEALGTLEDVAGQTSELLKKLSGVPATNGLTRQVTTLGDLVRRALDLLASAGRQHHVSATALHGLDRALLCEVDAAEMLRVVFNLLLNAYDAVKDEGNVAIRGEFDPEHSQVRLVIVDSGPGLPQAYLDNDLFRPFRTTKSGGLGLGLYQAKCIIEAHGGSLQVGNRGDCRGAMVTIALPAAATPEDLGAEA